MIDKIKKIFTQHKYLYFFLGILVTLLTGFGIWYFFLYDELAKLYAALDKLGPILDSIDPKLHAKIYRHIFKVIEREGEKEICLYILREFRDFYGFELEGKDTRDEFDKYMNIIIDTIKNTECGKEESSDSESEETEGEYKN